MKKHLLLCALVCFSISVFSQLTLQPSIGISSLPADTDPICAIACSTGWNFNNEGLAVGATIPQFQFYSISGTPSDALSLLQTGKPLCIVAGSYTCPVWRGKIAELNTLITTYGSQVNFLVVYVVEAHPNTPDISPYSCNVWVTTQNTTEGVLYLQPTTYGGRKAVATDMMNNTCSCMPTINAPMVIDGPCNEFWLNFGPAPNNAYLINPTNGTVYCKHGWFNQAPNDMGACISSLLTLLGVNEGGTVQSATVFPNPFTEQTTVRIDNSADFQLQVFDVTGREVEMNVVRNEEGFVISRGDSSSGIYFYKLMKDTETVSTGKLVVE